MLFRSKSDVVETLRAEFETDVRKVFPISAVSGKGLKELLYYVGGLLKNMDDAPIVYEQEFDPSVFILKEESYTVERADDAAFVVEGPKIEKMLGYTNIESEKGFLFFQKFLREQGILKELEERGIQDGDVVRMYGHEFDYYK